MSSSQKSRKKPPPKLGQSNTPTWVRGVVIVTIAALVISLFAFLAFDDNDDGSTDVTAGSSTPTSPDTTPAAAASAAGKPCVAVSEPLPPGAPEVPVAVGPPPTELISQDLVPGTGATVEPTSTITVDYIGVACSTGAIFDTSYGAQPATFPLDQVIPGWSQGLPGMQVGGTRLLGIPSGMAYGSTGSPPVIAPDEALWFVVQVRDAQAG